MKKRQRKKNRKRTIRIWKRALLSSGCMDGLLELYAMDRKRDAVLLRFFSVKEKLTVDAN